MEGVEPSTSRLWDLRSNQLSYIPFIFNHSFFFLFTFFIMSLASYVIGKGVKSLEMSFEEESRPNNKMLIITEEILYRKLINNHKSFMCFILFFHVSLLCFTILWILSFPSINENGFFCKNSLLLWNCFYLLLNFPLLFLSTGALFRNQAI